MRDPEYFLEDDLRNLEFMIPIEDLLREINYRVEKIQKGPEKWKCFCPIHQETIFRSLTINIGQRTFSCGFRQCPGHRGGSLLDLYRLACKKDEIETVQFWAERMGVTLLRRGESDATKIISEVVELSSPEVELDYDEQTYSEILEDIDREIEPSVSGIDQQQGPLAEPVDFVADSIEYDVDEREPQKLEIEDQLESIIEPDLSPPVLPPALRTVEQYVIEINQHLAEDRTEEVQRLLAEALEEDPNHPELLQVQARYYEKSDNIEKTLQVLERLLEIHRRRHFPDGCLQVAHQILKLDPYHFPASDAIVQSYLDRHDTNQALRVLHETAVRYMEQNQPLEALKRLEKIIEICPPGSPEESRALEEKIRILAGQGETSKAVATQIKLARLYIRKELVGKAGEILENTIESDPHCHEAYQILADLFLARGMQAQATQQMQRLAEQYLSDSSTASSENEASECTQKAISIYRQILEIEPKQTEIRNRLALLYKHSGQSQLALEEYLNIAQIYRSKEMLGRAIRVYENILKQDPSLHRAHQMLIEVLLEKGDESAAAQQLAQLAEIYRQSNNLPKAQETLEQAFRLEPESEERLEQLIAFYTSAEEKEKALQSYQVLLGILESKSDPEKIKSCLERMLELNPNHPQARNRFQQLEQAESKIIPGPPGSVQVLVAQAVQFQNENKPEEAIEALKAALLIESGNDQLWQDLADAYLKNNQLDQAADTFVRLSERLEGEGRIDRSLQVILTASERLSKLHYTGQLNLLRIQAHLELKSGSPEQALLTYQKIVQQEPNHAEHWFQLAQLADEQQREEQALESFRKAAQLFADAGSSKKAGQCLRRALELTPENTELRLQLALLLEQSGERSESVNQRLQVAKIFTATDSRSQALSTLEPIFEVQPDHLQALEQWLTLAESQFQKDSSTPEGSILPSRLDRAIHLVNLYKNQGLLGKAGQLLEHLQNLFPKEQSILRTQIDFYRETGAAQKAISLLLGLSRRYQEQERWEDALQCLQEARTSFPSATSDQPNILEAELKVHQARGDIEAQSALMMSLANLSADRGLIGKQISYLVQAWNLQPEKTAIGESLAEIYLAKGDESAAIDVFLRLIEKNREAQCPDAVQEGYERILNIRPTLVQVRFELSQHLMIENKKEDARRHLKRIAGQFSGQLPPADPELIPVLEQTYKQLIELSSELIDYLGLGSLYQAIQDYPAAGCAYLEALEHCPTEQPDKAIEICRQILEIAPGESAVEKRLADLYIQQGYKNEAALILHSLWNRYWRSFSLWLKSPEGQTQVASGALFDRVHETAGELLALEPENAQIHQQIVEFYSITGKPEQAIPHLVILGEIFTERGDKNQATQTYRQILDIHLGSTSESLEVRIRLAEVLESQGQVSEALHEYLVLGHTYEEQKLWEEAQTAFQRAVDIAPDNPEALEALLRIAKQQNQPEKVKKLLLQLADLDIDERGRLEAYLELDAQDRIVRERYVKTLARTGLIPQVLEQTNLLISDSLQEKQYDLALSFLDRIKEQFPQQIELYEMSVQVLEQQLRQAKRDKIPNTLIDRMNHQLNTQRLDFAGLVETAGDPEAASSLLSKICQSDSENEIARRRLIALFEAREEKDPADQKTASTLWQQLGDLLSRRGQLDEAGSAYSKALELSPRSRNIRQRLTTLNSERGLVEDTVAGQRQLARQALEEEDWNQAVEAYEEILRYLPDDEESLQELAKGYLELKDQFRAWEKAEALLLISERRQEAQQVLKWATFILQLDPHRVDIIQKQIAALTDLGQLNEAADWLWRLADLHRQSGEKGAEQSACLKLLEFGLDRFDLNRSAAERLFELGLERRARSELEQLAKQCLEQDKNSAAIEIYQALCERFQEETDYRIALAESLARADQCSLAVDQRLFLHDLYQKQNRPVEMVANLKSALDLAPEQAQLHELLGKVFAELGNFREAIQYLMKAAHLAKTEEDRLRAAQCYRTILQIEPDHLESLRNFHLLQTGCALNDEEKEELRQIRQHLIGLLADQGSDALPEMDRLAETLEADYPEDEETLRILSKSYRHLRPAQSAALTLRLLEKEIHKQDWRSAESDLRLVQSLFPSSLPLSGSFELDSLKALVGLCENTTLAEKVLPQRALLAEAYVDLQDREAAIRQFEILAETALDPMEHRQALIENLDIAGYHNRSREKKLTLAEFYRKQGRPSEAIACVQSALNYEKDNLECLQILTDLYLETNAIGQAGPVLKHMAKIAEEQGNFTQAEDYLKNLIEQSPPEGALLEDFSRLQQIRGQAEAARETQLQAAQIYERSGQVERAIQLLDHVIATFSEPSDQQVEIRHKLIDLLRQKGLVKEALAQEREIIEWYTRQEDYNRALECYEQMIEREPQNLIFPQEMADLLLRIDRVDEAVEILYRLSEIFRLREMLRRSQDTLQKILTLQPTHGKARRRLAEIYIEKGMESEGQAELLELARQIHQTQIPVDSIGEELVVLGQWILDLNAENCEILIGLANLIQDQREKEPEWATDLWIDIQLALVRQYLARGEVEQARSSIEQIEALSVNHPDLPDLRNRLDHLSRFQIPQETFRENVRKAEEHWEHGEFGAAANLLKQLLQSQPRDIDLIERLATAYNEQGHRTKAVDLLEKRGQIFLSERDFPKARQCFHRILTMVPGSIPVHTALAELALAEGNSKTAIDQYIHLVDLVENPEDWPQLVVALEKARNIDPRNEEVLRRLASSYRKTGALDQARETYRSLAELEKEHHRLESAVTALQEALACDLESRPDRTTGESLRIPKIQSAELHRELAEILAAQDNLSLAVEHWLTAGEIAAQVGEFDLAQTGFERVLDFPLNKLESSSLIRSYEGLANTYMQSGKVERAADILENLAKHYDSRNHPDQALQALQRAHHLVPEQRRHLEQLCQAYLKVGQEDEYIRSSLQLAGLLLNQDLFGRAEALYRTLRGLPRWEETSTSPNRGDPCYRNIINPLLELCLDKGATEDAIELLSDLAHRYEAAGEVPQALEQIERIHKVRPDHESALEWQAEIFIREDRKPEALRTFERLAALEEGKGYYSKAIDHYLRILDLDPNSPNVFDAIGRLGQIPGQAKSIVGELSHRFDQQFSAKNGPAVRALGQIFLRLDPRANQVRIRLPEVFLWENQPDSAIEHLTRLGRQYWKDQELTWARHCFQRILELTPQQPEAQKNLEEIDQQLAQKAQLEQQEQFRLKIESLLDSPEPSQALVEIEAYLTQAPEKGPTAKWAAELYEKAAQGENPFPLKVEPADRQAWLSHAQRIRLQLAESARSTGEYELACAQIEQILKLDPDHQEAGFQLLNTLATAGQPEQLLEQGMRLAHRYRSKGQIQAAVDTYRWMEKNGSPNPMLLGELASALVKLNLAEEAAQVYRRQADLFLEQELYAQALSAWNEILVLFPDDLRALQSLVQVYVLRGDMRGALIYCRKVLDQHLARNDYTEAENVLDQMIGFNPEQPSLRREKIELLLREGKQPLLVNELQALARLYLDQELINKAIEVWHEILEIEPDHRAVHRQLIEGYLQKGQPALAARQYLRMAETWQVRDALFAGECLKEALQLEPEEPELIRTYADHLAQQGLKKECLQQLEKLALILQGRGALSDAVEIYQKIIRMEPDNPDIVERLAGLYEELDQAGKAAPLWETLAEFYEVHNESSRAVETYLRAADHYFKVGIE